MFEPIHDAESKDLINNLVEHSETSKYTDVRKVQKISVNDWSEAVIGWKSVETAFKAPNSVATSGVKKKKVVERSLSDLHYGNSHSYQSDDYWSSSSASTDYKTAVRCVGDDFDSFPVPPWKSNIEQGTYRYVADNGSYRMSKFMFDDRREWYTIRKKYPEKVSTTWHQTCKRMQREMKRQLKKDLHMDKDKSPSSSSARNSARRSSEPSSGDDTNRSAFELSDQVARESIAIPSPTTENKTQKKELMTKQHELTTRPLYRKETRVKSTHSDGAVNYAKKMNTIHESEPVTPIPQYSIPSGGQLFKSASDLFIENFSSRISALEDEIKKGSKWLNKNENELTKLQTSRAKYREHTRANFKENSVQNVTPRMPLKTETLTSDIFSVKPVGGQKDLKPLEKTRSYTNNKISNSQGGDFFQHNVSIPSKGNYQFNLQPHLNHANYSSEIDKTINSYKSSIESTKQALFNTLTGTKINTQNNKRPSKDFSTPATITICDKDSSMANNNTNNSSNTNNSQNNRNTSENAFRNIQVPIVIEKKADKKAPVQTVPALLPEISGKRLEFSSISHRLL